MDARILVCGLNGVGKSTLGRFLAERIGCAALDIESYYFPVRHDYLCHRTPEEAYALLRRDMERLPSFVLASLRGDPSWPLTHVVLLGAPAQIRAGDRIVVVSVLMGCAVSEKEDFKAQLSIAVNY